MNSRITIAQGELTYMEEDNGGVYVVFLYTNPRYRNQGFARKLLRELIDLGYPTIRLIAASGEPQITTQRLMGLYRSEGFELDKDQRYMVYRRGA